MKKLPFNLKTESDREVANMKCMLYQNMYEQAHDIGRLNNNKTDALVAEIDVQLEECRLILDKKISGRVSDAQKDARKGAANKGISLQTKRTQLLVAKSDEYKKIAKRALVIQGYFDMIDFLEKFDGSIPALPFLDIEGTKYETTELGGYKKDEDGNKILYIAHGKGNVPKNG